jgi:CDGSH-type Zn-finger protein
MKIKGAPNGPYLLEGKPSLRRSSGKTYPVDGNAALCRCGGSKNKPFCDGTHKKIGFSDRNFLDEKRNHRETYEGRKITILDNRAICAHAGHCTDGLKEVFRMREEPWIAPDAAPVESIIETIRKCPSGALSYAIDGVEAAEPKRPPAITITDDGPYAVTGGIELAGVEFGDGASREHFTLCRCGASKNKPFCDGSHWEAGFKDS